MNQNQMDKRLEEAKRRLLECATEYCDVPMGWTLASLLKAIDDLEALTVEIALQDEQAVS